MSDDDKTTDEREEELLEKPTITIAEDEKQAELASPKETITIAEKQRGE